MQNIKLLGITTRSELVKEETEFMFEDAKKGLDRFETTTGLNYYYAKFGDQRFKIKNQEATAQYQYDLDVEMANKPTIEQKVNIKNTFEAYLKLKGDDVLTSIKKVEKFLKKEYNISCKLNLYKLEKSLEGKFIVKIENISDPFEIELELVSVENEKIITFEQNEEVNI